MRRDEAPRGPGTAADGARRTLEEFLAEAQIEWEPGAADGEYVLSLPGERKLKTVCSVVVGDQDVAVQAFVLRDPDENHAQIHRYLLRRNLRLPGLAYAIDRSGDVYVTGRVPTSGLHAAYLDRLLGVVLDASDGAFNELLAMGFLSSMRKEWAWRISRGESTRNLEAFRHLLEGEDKR